VAELREALLEADVDAETCSSTKIVIKSPGRLARSCPSKLSWPAFEKMEPSAVVSIASLRSQVVVCVLQHAVD
jgi:hypothetical protein